MALVKNKMHLFFDFDDTLWDFQTNSAAALEELFAEFQLHEKLNAGFYDFLAAYRRISLDLWSRYYKRLIDREYLRSQRFNECFREFGYESHEENLAITAEYRLRAPRGTCLKQDCREVLDYLHANYHLHIITNGFSDVQSVKIDGCGLRNYFSHIIISEEHSMVKPETGIFRLAEKMAGVKGHDCVMIGDSYESDIAGALNAGWNAVYFTENNPQDFKGRVITRLIELKNIF